MGVGRTLRAIKLSGREFPVEISLAPTENAAGTEVIVTMRDVSDRLLARQKERGFERSRALTRISQLALRERHFDAIGDQATQPAAAPLAARRALAAQGTRSQHRNLHQCRRATGCSAARICSHRYRNPALRLDPALGRTSTGRRCANEQH